MPIQKKHGAGTYSKHYEGIARKLERAIIEKAEDELPDKKKDVYKKYFIYSECPTCKGTRLNERALAVKINGITISQLCDMELPEVSEFLKTVKDDIAVPIIGKIQYLLENLIEIGVGYLSLNRAVSTLSGGESQRVKTACQLDCNLVDLLYIMDEPTTGLHMSDIDRLYRIIRSLVESDNTVIVIKHNLDIIKYADWIIDMGPEGGKKGGQVIFQGIPEDLINEARSHTGKYLKQCI